MKRFVAFVQAGMVTKGHLACPYPNLREYFFSTTLHRCFVRIQ